MRIQGRGRDALAARQPATAAIRPEDVQVGADAAASNRFRGRVEIVEYLGRDNEAVLTLEDQSSLWVRTPAHLAPGETVPVTFPPDKVIFLPGERGMPRHDDVPQKRRPRARPHGDALPGCRRCSTCVAMFVYPFLHGIYLSLRPAKQPGLSLANYVAFFSDEWQYGTIWITFSLAIPTTVIVVSTGAVSGLRHAPRHPDGAHDHDHPRAAGLARRHLALDRHPGLLWHARLVQPDPARSGLLSEPLRLTNNHTGVMLSLFMQQFPFCFLMLLGYISGIDPSLEKSARTLGAGPWTVFRRVMLPLIAPGLAIAFALVFVMSFAVFPSAILLGQPAGSTRTIAIAAYHQAFEHYDMSYASAIAVIMGLCQLAGLVLIVLVRQRMIDGAHDGRRKAVKRQCAAELWSLALYMFVLGFILNLAGIVSHVTVSAFAKRWFGTPLPPQFTTDWFVYAWTNFDLGPRVDRHASSSRCRSSSSRC